jgi:hypothetical protein
MNTQNTNYPQAIHLPVWGRGQTFVNRKMLRGKKIVDLN